MKKKINRTLIILAAFVALLAIGKLVFAPSQKNARSAERREKMELKINALILKRTALADTLTINGSSAPEESVDLAFEVSGKLIAVYFKEGSFVKAGAKIAKLNDADLQAQLKKAEAKVKLAAQKEARQKSLLAKQGTSQESYDESLTDLEQAKADVELLKAQIAKTDLLAPFDGYIGLRNVSTGAYLVQAAKVAVFQKLQKVKIDFKLPENFFNLLKIGDQIRFVTPNNPSVYSAAISALEPSVETETRSINARAIAANNDLRIPPGGTVKVFVSLKRQHEGFIIPAETLVPDIAGYKVFVYQSGKAKQKRVELYRRDADNGYVASGLEENDTLLTSAIMNLRQHLPVKIGIMAKQ